jgi:hypothetical protein
VPRARSGFYCWRRSKGHLLLARRALGRTSRQVGRVGRPNRRLRPSRRRAGERQWRPRHRRRRRRRRGRFRAWSLAPPLRDKPDLCVWLYVARHLWRCETLSRWLGAAAREQPCRGCLFAGQKFLSTRCLLKGALSHTQLKRSNCFSLSNSSTNKDEEVPRPVLVPRKSGVVVGAAPPTVARRGAAQAKPLARPAAARRSFPRSRGPGAAGELLIDVERS